MISVSSTNRKKTDELAKKMAAPVGKNLTLNAVGYPTFLHSKEAEIMNEKLNDAVQRGAFEKAKIRITLKLWKYLETIKSIASMSL